jgi:hypothetical protein
MNQPDAEHGESTHRPTLEELEKEFPAWTITRAVSGLWYAKRAPAPGVEPSGLIVGEDTDDLRDMLRGWIGRHDG